MLGSLALVVLWPRAALADVPNDPPSHYEACTACVPDDAGGVLLSPDGGYFASELDEAACARDAQPTTCTSRAGAPGRCGAAACLRYDPRSSSCACTAPRREANAPGVAAVVVALAVAGVRRRRR